MLSEELVAEDGELLGLRVLGAGVEDAVSAGGDDGASGHAFEAVAALHTAFPVEYQDQDILGLFFCFCTSSGADSRYAVFHLSCHNGIFGVDVVIVPQVDVAVVAADGAVWITVYLGVEQIGAVIEVFRLQIVRSCDAPDQTEAVVVELYEGIGTFDVDYCAFVGIGEQMALEAVSGEYLALTVGYQLSVGVEQLGLTVGDINALVLEPEGIEGQHLSLVGHDSHCMEFVRHLPDPFACRHTFCGFVERNDEEIALLDVHHVQCVVHGVCGRHQHLVGSVAGMEEAGDALHGPDIVDLKCPLACGQAGPAGLGLADCIMVSGHPGSVYEYGIWKGADSLAADADGLGLDLICQDGDTAVCPAAAGAQGYDCGTCDE